MARDGWEKFESLSKSIGIVAIPVVVALTGHFLNTAAEERQIRLQQSLDKRELALTEKMHTQELESIRLQHEQDVSVRYVEMAIGILTESPRDDATGATDPLREWAIRVVAGESPYHIEESARQMLRMRKLPDAARTGQLIDPALLKGIDLARPGARLEPSDQDGRLELNDGRIRRGGG